MLEIEEQLRVYGEAIERHLLADPPTPVVRPEPHRRHRRRLLAPAAVLLLVAGAVVAVRSVRKDEHVTTFDRREHQVFSTPTDTVLLFSDGIDGVTAIDLDLRVAGRRVIEGERAGDQPYRLTLTGDRLVVGWGGIYAAPLDGGPSARISDGTVYLPASEPGEVWVRTPDIGRLERLTVDGQVTFATDSFPPDLQPVIGIPGGLLVDSSTGVTTWDAATGALGPSLSPYRVDVASVARDRVVWCEQDCGVVRSHAFPSAAPGLAPSTGGTRLAVSPDGRSIAHLRNDGRLVVTSGAGEREVASGLVAYGSLTWGADGSQLFYATNSYLEGSMDIGRYEPAGHRWELRTIPVGDGMMPIALTREQATSFLSGSRVPAAGCPSANGSYPSGRTAACTFVF